MNLLSLLVGPVTDLVGGFLKNKREEGQAKHEARMEVIRNDANWETLMAGASASSWKDEWFTILLSTPILAVIWGVAIDDGSVMDRVHDALGALATLPEWYQYLLFVAVTASFGIRGADKIMELRKK